MDPCAAGDRRRLLSARGSIGPRWLVHSILTVIFVALSVLGTIRSSSAQNIIERLVNPGPLVQAHAKLEATCTGCHTPFTRTTQNSLCLDCHKPVNADVTAKTGFHGRNREIERSQCRRCHTDHKGRDADIVFLDRPLFDHTQTDFPLTGGHIGLACESCHAAGKPFRQAKSDCADCHAKDDVHKGRLGAACADCHVTGEWQKITRFDHGKTKFPLRGQHAKNECRTCHAGGQLVDLPVTCIGCHKLDDVHKGKFGAKCQDCHKEEGWGQVKFDHDTTQFPLRGAHAKIACDDCHKDGDFKAKLPMTCLGCHQKDDVHEGRLGPECQSCHDVSTWKKAKNFNHDKTEFPLRGAHVKTACDGCHAGNDFKVKLPVTCIGCHQKDDVHKGSFGVKCEGCHGVASWKDVAKFDHDKTRFPLLGKHKPVPCADCHKDPDFKKTPLQCQACHKDVFHKGRLGPECGQCHSANGWLKSSFDHAKTSFPLTGGHVDVDCHACHTKAVNGPPKVSSVCGECHRKDDVHRGSFGQNCGRCHSTRTFRR